MKVHRSLWKTNVHGNPSKGLSEENTQTTTGKRRGRLLGCVLFFFVLSHVFQANAR